MKGCLQRRETWREFALTCTKSLINTRIFFERALKEVFDGLKPTFTRAMNTIFTKDVTPQELSSAITSTTTKKAPRHNGLPIEIFQELCPTLGYDSIE